MVKLYSRQDLCHHPAHPHHRRARLVPGGIRPVYRKEPGRLRPGREIAVVRDDGSVAVARIGLKEGGKVIRAIEAAQGIQGVPTLLPVGTRASVGIVPEGPGVLDLVRKATIHPGRSSQSVVRPVVVQAGGSRVLVPTALVTQGLPTQPTAPSKEVSQTAVAKPAPVIQRPTPTGAAKPVGEGNMAVAINPTAPPPGGPTMDLGDALLQVGTQYVASKYGQQPQVIPAGLPIPGTTWELEGDIPFIDLAKRATKRRRQRKMITDTNMNVLQTIQASLQALTPSQAKLMMPLYLKAMRGR